MAVDEDGLAAGELCVDEELRVKKDNFLHGVAGCGRERRIAVESFLALKIVDGCFEFA